MFSLHLQCTERRLKKYYISFMLDYFLLRGGLIARYVILDFIVVGICLSSVKMLVCLFSIASEIIIILGYPARGPSSRVLRPVWTLYNNGIAYSWNKSTPSHFALTMKIKHRPIMEVDGALAAGGRRAQRDCPNVM